MDWQSVTVGAQLLWGGRYVCNNGRYGCTIVMSYIEINKAVSQWLLTFNLCVSVTWPLTCAFHIPCMHTPEIIDMQRGVCDNWRKTVPKPSPHNAASNLNMTIAWNGVDTRGLRTWGSDIAAESVSTNRRVRGTSQNTWGKSLWFPGTRTFGESQT